MLAVPVNDHIRRLPNKGFVGMINSLRAHGTDDLPISVLALEEEDLLRRSDYNAVFLLRRIGWGDEYVRHFKRNQIFIAAWQDDLFSSSWRTAQRRAYLMDRFSAADLIFLPYLRNFLLDSEYRRFARKAVALPWAVPDTLFDDRALWAERAPRVLLSGRVSWAYPLRAAIRRDAQTDSSTFVDVLQHPGYHASNSARGTVGMDYYRMLSSYRGAIATTLHVKRPPMFGKSLMNYTVAKYFEIPGCGCLSFFERTPDLEQLGFVDGENYIAIDRANFRRKLSLVVSDEGKEIAERGRSLVQSRHTFSCRVHMILSCVLSELSGERCKGESL